MGHDEEKGKTKKRLSCSNVHDETVAMTAGVTVVKKVPSKAASTVSKKAALTVDGLVDVRDVE